jgi:hypothetical protein
MDAEICDNASYLNAKCPQCGHTILHDAIITVRLASSARVVA